MEDDVKVVILTSEEAEARRAELEEKHGERFKHYRRGMSEDDMREALAEEARRNGQRSKR
jgi:hypothetical protein